MIDSKKFFVREVRLQVTICMRKSHRTDARHNDKKYSFFTNVLYFSLVLECCFHLKFKMLYFHLNSYYSVV